MGDLDPALTDLDTRHARKASGFVPLEERCLTSPEHSNFALKPAASRGVPRWVIPMIGLAALALAALLYHYDLDLYFRLLHVLMVTPYVPPFIDGQQIPAVIACWRMGVDVFVNAPCDPQGRVFAYSPLWLRATFLEVPWTPWIGLVIDSVVIVSLALLPLPRSRRDTVLFALAMLSGMPVFALERLNIDVIMFLLILFAGWCWTQSSALRFVGYPLMALAGFLKFYPLTLFLLFLRERLAGFILLSAAGLLLVAAFFWAFHGELAEALQNVPHFRAISEVFGAVQLPSGIGRALDVLLGGPAGAEPNIHSPVIAASVLLVMALFMLSASLWLARRADFAASLRALARAEFGFLLIGAVLLSFCFVGAQNLYYRGIHLLFIMPAMLALARGSGSASSRRLFGFTLGTVLFVMWSMTLQRDVVYLTGGPIASGDPGTVYAPPVYLFWIFRELAWWWIVTVLLAVIYRFVLESPVWQSLRLVPRPAPA